MTQIIHYIWIDFKNEQNPNPTIPQHLQERMDRCASVNKNYEIVVWNGKMCRELIQSDFPDYLELYDSLETPIMRCDMIRYFILFKHGGFYLDMDRVCIKPFELLLKEYQDYDVLLGEFRAVQYMPYYMINNDFIYCAKPQSDFMRFCIKHITPKNYGIHFLNVMLTAGPYFLAQQYKDYDGTEKIKVLYEEVNMCNPVYCDPTLIGKAYTFSDMSNTSWSNKFERVCYHLYQYIYFIVIIILLVIIIILLRKLR